MGQAKQKKEAQEKAREAFLEQHVVLKRRDVEPILQFLLKQGPLGEVAPLFNTLQRAQPVNLAKPARPGENGSQEGKVSPEDIPKDIQELIDQEQPAPRLHVPGE